MFKLYVIAGSHDQYKAWLRSTNTHPDAAVCVTRSSQLRDVTPDNGEVRLVGEYTKNPVYLSVAHMRVMAFGLPSFYSFSLTGVSLSN